MKNRKFLSLALAAVLAVSLFAVPALAAGTLPEDGEVNYTPITGDDGVTTDTFNEIPVYGYVGEDAEIEDPDDPNNPDPSEPPEVNPYEINVSVPVKIIWAAFESDNGVVTSPNYYIKNNSKAADGTHDLDVELTSFTKVGTTENDAIDPFLTLILKKGTPTTFSTATEPTLVSGNGTAATYLPAAVDLNDKLDANELKAGDTWYFSLGGDYDYDHASNTDGFNVQHTPTYMMVFTFSVGDAS